MIAVQMGVDQGMQWPMFQHGSDPSNGLIGVRVVTTVNQCISVMTHEQHAVARQPATFQDVNTQRGQIMKRHRRAKGKNGFRLSQEGKVCVALYETDSMKNAESRP